MDWVSIGPMLFLVNEKEHTLTGRMAVGPDSTCGRPERSGTASQVRRGDDGPDGSTAIALPEDSILNSVVKGIHIPLEQRSVYSLPNGS